MIWPGSDFQSHRQYNESSGNGYHKLLEFENLRGQDKDGVISLSFSYMLCS